MGNIFAIRDTSFLVSASTRPAARGNIRELFSSRNYICGKKVVFFGKSKTCANNIGVIALFTISMALRLILAPAKLRNRDHDIAPRGCEGSDRRENKKSRKNNRERNERGINKAGYLRLH